MNQLRSIALSAFSIFAISTHAFPDMIRHKYVSCTSCHFSPAGGGTLTPYGRELSAEALSTWSYSGQEQFDHGLLGQRINPKYMKHVPSVGGDIRGIQTHQENRFVKQGEWFWMQADLELAHREGPVWGAVSYGRYYARPKAKYKSRKFYVGADLNKNFSARIGRFTPQYGLNIPEHTAFIRSDLGLNQGQETHNAEFTWQADSWSMVNTLVFPRKEKTSTQKQQGVYSQVSYAFAGTYKVGAQYSYLSSGSVEKQNVGVHALFGFTEKLFALVEVDVPKTLSTRGKTRGYVHYLKLGYELTQGLQIAGTHELARSEWKKKVSEKQSFGLSTSFFPIPHVELQATWQKLEVRSIENKYGDYAWLLLHYYF